MTSSIKLKHNLSADHLNQTYEDDYYAYLRSDAFKDTFMAKIGHHIRTKSVLDVGCGEGQLAEFVGGSYIGIDGSAVAIANAIETYKGDHSKYFEVGRIENPPKLGHVQVVVFSAILDFMVEPESYIPLFDMYAQLYQPEMFIICDLVRGEFAELKKVYKPKYKDWVATVEYDGIPDIKKTRKVIVLSGKRCDDEQR